MCVYVYCQTYQHPVWSRGVEVFAVLLFGFVVFPDYDVLFFNRQPQLCRLQLLLSTKESW